MKVEELRMRNKKLGLLTSLSFLLISLSIFVPNAAAYVAYKYNPVAAQVQEKSLWCWAATASMAAKYLGASSATQTNIVTFVKGSAVNDTGTVYDIKNGMAHYTVYSTALLSSLSFGDIIYNIDRNMNMVAVVTWTSGGGHAYLIRGYYQDTGAGTSNVYYIDPADGSYNIKSYSTFKNNSASNWVNSVTAIYA